MRVAVTGTPGAGKSTAAQLAAEELGYDVVELSEHAEEFSIEYDEERDTTEVDVESMDAAFEDRDDVLFDSHLSHHLDVDHVVVLRCHPMELEGRLRERGYDEAKVRENASSETLDLLAAEAIHRYDEVYEIDTTGSSPGEVAEELVEAVRSRLVNASSEGVTVDWSGYLEDSIDPEDSDEVER